ncbi:MAG: sugar ABC transporter permease [Bacillales bacterium]|nr:sugar ABC transporter permease [Bacillales bacterium]
MKMKNSVREAIVGYSFIIIWIIGFIFLTAYPIIMSIIYSVNDVTIAGTGIKMQFSGLANYGVIFSSAGSDYLTALKEFLGQVILRVPIILVFSIIIALLLNQKIRFRGFFRTIFFLPVIISSGPVISELVSQGAAGENMMSSLTFLDSLQNTLNPVIADPIVTLFEEIIIVFWFSGVQVLLFLSALQKINKEIYEAAAIDGAGPWESFWKITLPSMKNIVFVNAIYTLVLLATYSENGVVTAIKNNMFSITTGYGVASAMAWAYFIVLALLLLIIVLLFRPGRESDKG